MWRGRRVSLVRPNLAARTERPSSGGRSRGTPGMGNRLRVEVPPGGGGADRSHRQGRRREARSEGSPLRRSSDPSYTNRI
jgi:hypothetical protein